MGWARFFISNNDAKYEDHRAVAWDDLCCLSKDEKLPALVAQEFLQTLESLNTYKTDEDEGLTYIQRALRQVDSLSFKLGTLDVFGCESTFGITCMACNGKSKPISGTWLILPGACDVHKTDGYLSIVQQVNNMEESNWLSISHKRSSCIKARSGPVFEEWQFVPKGSIIFDGPESLEKRLPVRFRLGSQWYRLRSYVLEEWRDGETLLPVMIAEETEVQRVLTHSAYLVHYVGKYETGVIIYPRVDYTPKVAAGMTAIRIQCPLSDDGTTLDDQHWNGTHAGAIVRMRSYEPITKQQPTRRTPVGEEYITLAMAMVKDSLITRLVKEISVMDIPISPDVAIHEHTERQEKSTCTYCGRRGHT
jgi:hypothetical protein